MPILNEVSPGVYDLRGLPSALHPAYDFVGRQFFNFTNGSGPSGEDQLHTYSMTDHSLVSTININWDAYVSGKGVNAFFDPLTGHIWVQCTPANKILAIDPTDGSVIANISSSGANEDAWWHQPSWARIEIGGVSVLAQDNVFNNKFNLTKLAAPTFDFYAQVSGTSGGKIIGFRDIDGTNTALYWMQSGNIRETIVSLAGVGATRTMFTPGHSFQSAMYDSTDGSVILINGTRVVKYELVLETYAVVWDKVGILNQGSMTFGRVGISTAIERIGIYGVLNGQDVHVIQLSDGALLEIISKAVVVDFTGPDMKWDDLGGAAWYDNSGNDTWRFQGDPLFYGLHPSPRPLNFERPRPNSSCDC